MALKQHGTATISQLAGDLGLTGEAVRQQLLQLQREGWVEPATRLGSAPARTGRPATSYRLTEAGDHLFPKHYDSLAVAIIDAVAEELGTEAATRVLERVSNDRVAAMEPSLRGLDLRQRVEALKNWYLDGDPYMDSARDGDDLLLIERNCPFLNTAMSRPALCSVTVNALTRLFGVRVHREEKFQNGDGRCVFRARTREPIDPKSWTFRLEN